MHRGAARRANWNSCAPNPCAVMISQNSQAPRIDVAAFLICVYHGWVVVLTAISLAVFLLRYAVVPYANHLVASLGCLHEAVASDGRALGLDGSTIARLPCFVVVRRAGGGDDDAIATAECVVCLGDVEEGETVRALPCCRHAFHARCIDAWLRLRPTCPVCRETFR